MRHGKTVQPGTYTGRTNVGLSVEGRRQITALSPFFHSIRFDGCFCSPLSRCVETLNLLHVDVAPIFDDRLQEIDFGSWEGLSFEQVRSDRAAQLDDWVRLGEEFSFPGGEKIRNFNARISDWVDTLLTKDVNRTLIIAHAGVIRIAICHLLGLETARVFAFNPLEGCVSMVRAENGFGQLEMLNCRG